MIQALHGNKLETVYTSAIKLSNWMDTNLPQEECIVMDVSGINFGASLVSLFYGNGDLLETIKIGTLAGWDSDNPTATWGGMLGFILGNEGVEKEFDRTFSSVFHIHLEQESRF